MADDFAKTAEDMMKDASALHQAGRYRNACYLAGYVVECTLKRLLLAANFTGKIRRHELDLLLQDLDQLASLQPQNPPVPRLGPSMLRTVSKMNRQGAPTPGCHWDPEHRYDGSRWDDQGTADTYLREAEEAFQVLVDRLQLNQGGP